MTFSFSRTHFYASMHTKMKMEMHNGLPTMDVAQRDAIQAGHNRPYGSTTSIITCQAILLLVTTQKSNIFLIKLWKPFIFYCCSLERSLSQYKKKKKKSLFSVTIFPMYRTVGCCECHECYMYIFIQYVLSKCIFPALKWSFHRWSDGYVTMFTTGWSMQIFISTFERYNEKQGYQDEFSCITAKYYSIKAKFLLELLCERLSSIYRICCFVRYEALISI